MECKDNNGSRETRFKAITLTHMRNDAGLGQFGSGGYGGKWSDSGFILKIEPVGFHDKLNDVEHEKKKTSKITPKFLA